MRVTIFLLLALGNGQAYADCGNRPVISSRNDDGSEVGIFITDRQKEKSPKWNVSSGDPPLSISKAINAALTWARSAYKRYDDVQVHSISLNSLGCSVSTDQWYYIVHLSPVIDGNKLYGSAFMAAVLMDGTVIGPTPVK